MHQSQFLIFLLLSFCMRVTVSSSKSDSSNSEIVVQASEKSYIFKDRQYLQVTICIRLFVKMHQSQFLIFLLLSFCMRVTVSSSKSDSSNSEIVVQASEKSVVDRGFTTIADFNVDEYLEFSRHYHKDVHTRKFEGKVLGYITPWNGEGYQLSELFRHKFTHLSPVWYQLRSVSGVYQLAGRHDVKQDWLQKIRAPAQQSGDVVPKILPRFVFEIPPSALPSYESGMDDIIDMILKEIIKKADKTMGHEYVTKIVPQCDCEGVYILEDKYCPSCDTILEELKKCSGTQKTTGVIEIQEKCLAIVGVTEKVLSKCGFIETKPTKLTKKQYVQVVDPTIKKDEQVVVVVQPQIPVDTPKATATAIATASAVGGSAVANAVVSASGGKNL
eukprot:TRINITY_DN44528_c0_g1_i2.p1 TRINITY_DN44528_c0_g1~~TRINITY_DN44528_c0_g1_i2.p1  ORF type:complete len:415 (-),score=38.84 TRINITY_DN44528_c0_g1_i2:274-1434(-)